MAQQKKDRPVHSVLPLRTAPSQMMACRPRSGEPGRHQVSTRLCFSEKTKLPLLLLHGLEEPVNLILAAVVHGVQQPLQQPPPVREL